MPHRHLVIAIHIAALSSIVIALTTMAIRDPHTAEIFTSALLGFICGILFDRYGLRPLVDWRLEHGTRGPHGR